MVGAFWFFQKRRSSLPQPEWCLLEVRGPVVAEHDERALVGVPTHTVAGLLGELRFDFVALRRADVRDQVTGHAIAASQASAA